MRSVFQPTIPTFRSLGLVTPARSRRHAYRLSQTATPGLTTSDVGLSLGLAYARVMHTAPGYLSSLYMLTKLPVTIVHLKFWPPPNWHRLATCLNYGNIKGPTTTDHYQMQCVGV